jgi:hypothetical protein
MAASGALPLEPIELATVLFTLSHDSDHEVKDTARRSLEELPENVARTVLSGPTHPAVLSYLAKAHSGHDEYAELIALNSAASDETIAYLASLPLLRVVDIISNNQERMLRCEEIVEALGSNPLTGRAVIERIFGFLGITTDAESGLPDDELKTEDLSEEQTAAALTALLGEDMKHIAHLLAAEEDQEIDEETSGSLYTAIQGMSVMQKIKLARTGGKEARALLIRDRNKVVSNSVLASPKITSNEVTGIAQSRGVSDDILRIISMNREWTKGYKVKLALATNPKSPQPTAIKFLNYIQDKDLRSIMKSRDVSTAISTHARRILDKKGKI